MEETKTVIAVVLWLTLLTMAVVRLFVGNIRERKALRESLAHIDNGMRQLDMKAEIMELTRLMRQGAIHADARLREGVERLIARMEADPLTAERYRVDLTALKESIR